jgi:hypothetical protein
MHRIIFAYFLFIVFVNVIIMSTLYVFDYLCFPFAVFVQCSINSNLSPVSLRKFTTFTASFLSSFSDSVVMLFFVL